MYNTEESIEENNVSTNEEIKCDESIWYTGRDDFEFNLDAPQKNEDIYKNDYTCVRIPIPPQQSETSLDLQITESASLQSEMSIVDSDSDMSFEPEVSKKMRSKKQRKSSKRNNLSKKDKNPRKDVVLKTILRKMRKFFI